MIGIGRNLYRLKDNPCEKAFSKAWLDMMARSGRSVVAHICGEKVIDEIRETDCASVIQWLGSPVGQRFVIDVLEEQGLVKRLGVLEVDLLAMKRQR